MLILTLTIVVGVLIFICLIFMKELLQFTQVRLNHIRVFTHKNSGIFTILFILLFFIEQIALILFTYSINVEARAQLLIGIFALIVLTTATLEKFILEKKYQYLSKEAAKLAEENELKLKDMKNILKENERLEKHKKN